MKIEKDFIVTLPIEVFKQLRADAIANERSVKGHAKFIIKKHLKQ
tara:strand:+ start:3746 stop:3880 length:135 start_codon:yes stop_codon:yes gene_type:complete